MKGEKVICPVCGKEFTKKSGKTAYCSHNCYMVWWRETHKKVYKKTCLVCGREFETSVLRAKYCGEVCGAEAKRLRAHERSVLTPHEPKICKYCGEAFIPKNIRALYCCEEHGTKYRSETAKKSASKSAEKRGYPPKPCALCGKEFTPASGSSKYCCDECRTEANRIRNSRPGAEASSPAHSSETVPQKKTLAKLNRAAKRWATMSWDEVVRENMYYGLRYPDSQIMAYAGTLPEDYGLKRKKAKQ